MGMDLRLLPVQYVHTREDGSRWGYAHSVIDMPRNYEVFEAIEALPSLAAYDFTLNAYAARVPDGPSRGETMYGEVTRDAYYGTMRAVLAGELAGCLDRFVKVPDWKREGEHTDDPRTLLRAACAYVMNINPRALVALYWH